MMILVRNSVIFFKSFQTYNYVYFITLQNIVIFVRPLLIKLAILETTPHFGRTLPGKQ
jgi:hypothetical protein